MAKETLPCFCRPVINATAGDPKSGFDPPQHLDILSAVSIWHFLWTDPLKYHSHAKRKYQGSNGEHFSNN